MNGRHGSWHFELAATSATCAVALFFPLLDLGLEKGSFLGGKSEEEEEDEPELLVLLVVLLVLLLDDDDDGVLEGLA